MTGQLSAATLALATVNDPQFTVPSLPCVVPGAVFVWVEDGLLVEGTGSRRVLTGRSAREMLPGLLPLLDGTRGLEQLGAAIGHPPARVRAVLLLLYSCGLLQQGPGAPDVDATPQYRLLGRLLDSTRVNANAGQAQGRLQRATVGIHASDDYADLLAAHLQASGVRTVRLRDVDDVQPLDLAVVHADAAAGGPSRELCRALRQLDVACLLVGLSGTGLVLGPYSATDYGPCTDCCLEQGREDAVGGDGAGDVGVAAALTAIEVVALISRIGAPASLRGRCLLDARHGRSSTVHVAPRPGCPVCGDPRAALVPAPVAYAYETSVAFPPRRLVNPRDHQHHFEPSNVALQHETKAYPDLPGVDLPSTDLPAALVPGGESTGARLTLEQLGLVLAGACGLKVQPAAEEGRPLRWAPSGGNLGSPQAYVLARAVDGLPEGSYAYAPVGHRLVRLDAGLPPDFQHMPQPAAVVFTGALFRVARKYRTFAYRVIHLDTGAALAHVLLLCRSLGLPLVNEPNWDDAALTAALRVDRQAEAVTAVLRVGGQA